MPIHGEGWEILIQRSSVQRRNGRARTVGTYRVFHDGEDAGIHGTTAESGGPGDNSVAKNRKRVEAGRYPLATQDGTKYDTYDYREDENPHVKPKPGIELRNTGKRSEILIQQGLDSSHPLDASTSARAFPWRMNRSLIRAVADA
jgi:hypothetical protein